MTGSGDGLARWAGEHPGRTAGRRIVVSRRTESTHEDARRLARSLGRDAHGLVVTTREQTGGRGTRGRSWWSPPGRSLALSIVWAPVPPLRMPAALTLATATAVVRAGERRGAELRVRWPNDVVTTDGRKVAGVLAETLGGAPAVHVVGVGVNVLEPLEPPPFTIDRPYGSLSSAGGGTPDPDVFFGEVLDACEEAYRDGDAGVAEIVGAFNSRSWLTGRRVTLRRGERTVSVIFRGLTPTLEVTFDDDSGAPGRWPGEQVELVDWS